MLLSHQLIYQFLLVSVIKLIIQFHFLVPFQFGDAPPKLLAGHLTRELAHALLGSGHQGPRNPIFLLLLLLHVPRLLRLTQILPFLVPTRLALILNLVFVGEAPVALFQALGLVLVVFFQAFVEPVQRLVLPEKVNRVREFHVDALCRCICATISVAERHHSHGGCGVCRPIGQLVVVPERGALTTLFEAQLKVGCERSADLTCNLLQLHRTLRSWYDAVSRLLECK